MTITLTKKQLALAIVAVAMLVPATALATHVFDDVDDGRFYADPVEWAADNAITTGKTPTSFDPEGNVTRGESVTFLKRYHDNLAQPGIDAAQAAADAAQADADANAADIATLQATDLSLYWAFVSGSTGAVSAGSDGVTGTRNGTGSYTIDFDGTDVTECAWSVSTRYGPGLLILLSGDEYIYSMQQGYTGVFPTYTTISDEIIVFANDESGTAVDQSFQIMVVC